MNGLQREREIKLQFMGAIARSQEALARILESTADVTETVGITSASIQEHVRVLTGMQGALLQAVCGMSWQAPVQGKPVSPWLSDQIKHSKYDAGVGML